MSSAALLAMQPDPSEDSLNSSAGIPRQRAALRSVPASGKPGDGGLDDPLRLGRAMRLRLLAAVQALLADPSIAGQSDVARLAAVVLYAKSRAPKGAKNDNQTSIWVAELGRWMGVGESTVNRRVLVPLRASDGLHTKEKRNAKGRPTGLECLVMPLWNARKSGGAAHPLALSKAELATLLRLCEALFGPGWTPEDKEPTPPGLLAGRTGKGAATDRLGLLLMVLNTRASGWLQLCGGSVKAKEGRGAATLARLLGCSPSGARKVLARLTEAGVVARDHRDTATRMRGKGRVMLLPVARAYGRTPASVEAVSGLGTVFSQRPAGAVGDHAPAAAAGALGASGIGGAEEAGDAAVQERPDGAELHADHASVVTPVVPPQLSGGFSGEGRGGEGRRPGRACVREDQAVDGESAVAGSGSLVAGADPLRGEKPTKSPVDEQEQAGTIAAGARAGARLTVVGGRKTQQQGRPELPADLDLRVALAPVSWLWRGLNRWQQDRVVEAAKVELAQLRNVLEWSGQAPSALAARLTSRLEETGGEALVTRPFGWITRRGLVRRPSCSDVRCDDGVRLDTGADCDNCANILHSRRAWRVRIAAEVDQELPGLEQDARYREIEARMRRHAEAEAAGLVARQAEAREREAQAAVERERAAAEAAARQAVACQECGRERSAGLCEACGHRRQVEVLIGEAGLLAAAWSADLTDPVAVAAVVAEVRTAIEDAIAAAWAQFQEITDPAALEAAGPNAVEDAAAYNAVLTAESAAAEYRHEALVMLGRSEEAQAEARKAYATELAKPWFQALPDSDDAQRAATGAAAKAQTRTAEHLLAVRLEQLHIQARPAPVRGAAWSRRLPELAARQLDGEALEVTA
ncbi:hypothetical protein BJP40_02290 [Streptomyces sp. CC53]|uniref:hypothetical protein n=1 Tax=Streptomyces sp. CC53 TaxID=1906740 RepID=UPI0008DE65E6|nr:hypothetical protein [Streptomyces sp. CC53]OII64363.1 hypothetical protein BJP40_02290 [Streptomyces sp. CC53]